MSTSDIQLQHHTGSEDSPHLDQEVCWRPQWAPPEETKAWRGRRRGKECMPRYYPDIWSGLSGSEHQLGAGERSQHGGVGSARQSESVIYLSLHTHKCIHELGGGCMCVHTYIHINICIHNSLSRWPQATREINSKMSTECTQVLSIWKWLCLHKMWICRWYLCSVYSQRWPRCIQVPQTGYPLCMLIVLGPLRKHGIVLNLYLSLYLI